MRHTVTYATSDGASFDLSSELSGSGILWDTGLMAWEFDADDGTGELSREPASFGVTAAFPDAATANDFAIRTYADSAASREGTLSVDGWRLSCSVSAGTPEVRAGGRCRCALTLRSQDPVWRRITLHHLLSAPSSEIGPVDTGQKAIVGSGEEPTGLDYPTDYEFDYANQPPPKIVVSDADYPFDYGFDYAGTGMPAQAAATFEVPTACAVRLTFFGPCVGPYASVTSDGPSGTMTNRYGVDSTAAEGERIVVDPLGVRTVGGSVYKVGTYGQRTNLFDKRVRGAEGSGTYAFQRLPAGTLSVTWPRTCALDVETIEERGSLPWI